MDLHHLEQQKRILERKLNQTRLSLNLIQASSTPPSGHRTPELHCYDGPLQYFIHCSPNLSNELLHMSPSYSHEIDKDSYCGDNLFHEGIDVDDESHYQGLDNSAADIVSFIKNQSRVNMDESLSIEPESDNYILNNLNKFVMQAARQKVHYKCKLTRDRKHSTCSLYLENEGGKKIFLLIAHKKKTGTSSNYLISSDPTDLSKESYSFVGKLRSNLLGTEFSVFNNGRSFVRSSNSNRISREELAAIVYDANVLGLKGPRKMTVVIPGMDHEHKRVQIATLDMHDSILECWKTKRMDNLIELHNKAPKWNGQTQSYILDFHTQGTQASAKNFQIVHDTDENYVIMQFCRVSEDIFTMEYRYPLCPLQAFAIALSSLDTKIACS